MRRVVFVMQSAVSKGLFSAHWSLKLCECYNIVVWSHYPSFSISKSIDAGAFIGPISISSRAESVPECERRT
jgi:hypothetical protein